MKNQGNLVDLMSGEEVGAEAVDCIVTMRASDVHAATVIPGSVERICALCDAAVLVAPSTLLTFARRTMPPIWCAPCALDATWRGGRA